MNKLRDVIRQILDYGTNSSVVKDSTSGDMELAISMFTDFTYEKMGQFFGNFNQGANAALSILRKNNKFTDVASVFSSWTNVYFTYKDIQNQIEKSGRFKASSITDLIGDSISAMGATYATKANLSGNKMEAYQGTKINAALYFIGNRIKAYGKESMGDATFSSEDFTPRMVAGFFMDPKSYADLGEHDSRFFYGMLPDQYNPWKGGTNAVHEKIIEILEMDFSQFDEFLEDMAQKGYEALISATTDGMETLANTDWSLFGDFLIDSTKDGWNWFTTNLKDWFGIPREDGVVIYDPLTLDLDGDGIEAIASNGHKGVLFDHDKDGIRTATGWVGKDDGFLVYDRNGDGVVNDGSELFGDNTLLKNGERATNGYQALADLDDNGDGKVDAADSAFAKLRVWRDLNQDGISQQGELLTLNEAKVKALNLANKNTDRDLGNGNSLAEEGTYTDSDGNEKQMGDLNLAADHFHSRYSDSLPLTDEQQQAPNLRGSGRVRDLREAAAQSPDVAAALQAYANAQTKEEQLALRDQLLRAWAGTDKRFTTEGVLKAASKNFVMASSGKGNAIMLTPGELQALGTIEGPDVWTLLGIEDPDKKKKAALHEKIGILDAFTGTDSSHLYYGTKAQAQHTIDTIEKTYANLADNLYDGLLFQTRLNPYLNAIRFGMSEDGKLQLDYSGVATLLDEVHAKNPGKAFTDLGELLAKGNADGKNTDMAPLAEKFVQYAQEADNNGSFEAYSKVLGEKNMLSLGYTLAPHGDSLGEKILGAIGYNIGKDGDDALYGNSNANYLHGGNGNDMLDGHAGDDTLNGGAGNDALFGNIGHDTLDGGAGDDYMEGGNFESDTYIFRVGHGKDAIKDLAWPDQADTLRFEGALAEKAQFGREGNNLVIQAYGSNDQVSLVDYFYGEGFSQYHFQFDDATWGREDMFKKTFTFGGTENNEGLGGWISDDIIHGKGGDDDIRGYEGNDALYGDAGNDALHGDGGDDTLDGGEGNDFLEGNQGNDTLNGGAGNDALYGHEGKDTLDGGTGDDYMEGGNFESDTYIFRVGHGKDTIRELAVWDTQADTLRFEGAQAEKARFSREGRDLVVKAYDSDDQVSLKDYFYGEGFARYDFHFDDATFKAAELRGKDLPTEGLKAPVDAATQTADTQTKTTVPAEENAPPENSAPTASTTTDDSKKAETNAQKPIVASDPVRPAPQKVIAETAGNTPQANADADVASGDSTAAADTPANVVAAAAETAQPAENGAAASTAKNAAITAKPATALAPVTASTKIQPATVAADTQQTPAAAASASGDSSATASQKASPATAQQNATAVADALKTGGTTAAAASALDANAARQSQQMLSAMAAQGQTASPTTLAAPDLQPKPQLVASQV